jgi:dihydrofolate synthase/folylpolyglutamate synthase
VLTPLVSVITNVGSDHADVLGATVEAIALDKSGIIKDKVPVVTAADHPGALEVIREAAVRKRAPLTIVQEEAHIESAVGPAYGQRARVVTGHAAYELALPLLGEFQVLNAATAIVALEQISAALPVSPSDAARGLAGVALPGRMEFYPSRPSIIFDIAHNAEKAVALREGLLHHFPDKRFVFVVAVAEGKAIGEMMAAWAQLPAHFIFTSFDVLHRSAVRPQRLALAAEGLGLAARAVDDPVEALSIARRMAGADDLVVITGSTFLVANLLEWFTLNVAENSHARS